MFLGFVGFSELDPEVVMKFLRLDRETAGDIVHRTWQRYLGTYDEARIQEVEDKARIVGYARLMRRTIRRESDTEAGQRMIEHCRERLIDLLSRVDPLDF